MDEIRKNAINISDSHCWDRIVTLTIWDTPELKGLLDQPLGAPIELSFEEADEIVRLAAGRRPDLNCKEVK